MINVKTAWTGMLLYDTKEKWFGYLDGGGRPTCIHISSVQEEFDEKQIKEIEYDCCNFAVVEFKNFVQTLYRTKTIPPKQVLMVNPLYANLWDKVYSTEGYNEDALISAFIKITMQSFMKKDYNKFLSILTSKEKDALIFIINEIGAEGDVSISSLVSNSKISRPVFMNLLAKLQEEQMVTATSHGVKGTHLTFDQDLLTQLGQKQ